MTCKDCRYLADNKCHYYGWAGKSPCGGCGEKTRGLSGYDEQSGLYKSRYYAQKVASENEVIIKTDGGYKIIAVGEYNIRRRQK